MRSLTGTVSAGARWPRRLNAIDPELSRRVNTGIITRSARARRATSACGKSVRTRGEDMDKVRFQWTAPTQLIPTTPRSSIRGKVILAHRGGQTWARLSDYDTHRKQQKWAGGPSRRQPRRRNYGSVRYCGVPKQHGVIGRTDDGLGHVTIDGVRMAERTRAMRASGMGHRINRATKFARHRRSSSKPSDREMQAVMYKRPKWDAQVTRLDAGPPRRSISTRAGDVREAGQRYLE